MKSLIPALALALLAACGTDHDSKETVPSIAAQFSTAEAAKAAVATSPNTNKPGTDAYGNVIVTNWYPSDAPLLRKDLYLCSSLTSGAIKFRTFIEIFMDNSRLYHVSLSLKDGKTENFEAIESAKDGSAFYPINMTIGAQQSTNVLHGINADTKAAYSLSDSSNWKINMRSSQQKGNSEMFITVDGNTGNGSVSIPYGTCYRVGQ